MEESMSVGPDHGRGSTSNSTSNDAAAAITTSSTSTNTKGVTSTSAGLRMAGHLSCAKVAVYSTAEQLRPLPEHFWERYGGRNRYGLKDCHKQDLTDPTKAMAMLSTMYRHYRFNAKMLVRVMIANGDWPALTYIHVPPGLLADCIDTSTSNKNEWHFIAYTLLPHLFGPSATLCAGWRDLVGPSWLYSLARVFESFATPAWRARLEILRDYGLVTAEGIARVLRESFRALMLVESRFAMSKILYDVWSTSMVLAPICTRRLGYDADLRMVACADVEDTSDPQQQHRRNLAIKPRAHLARGMCTRSYAQCLLDLLINADVADAADPSPENALSRIQCEEWARAHVAFVMSTGLWAPPFSVAATAPDVALRALIHDATEAAAAATASSVPELSS